ncbi:response regulator transcription factor [Streptomyces sp. NPDC002573]|uniref:response regulator transcription factor n=1 Tax=Streptomyces sp. NPDC002573 TaxID=3364651 RepID=UPI00367B27EE
MPRYGGRAARPAPALFPALSAAARDLLTPQEPQIAQPAASGLSNREIGRQLYLSHRTIGAHLYRIYPKLGITSRGPVAGEAPAGRLRSGCRPLGPGTRRHE